MAHSEKQAVLDTLLAQQAAWQNKNIDTWVEFFTEDSDFVTWRGVWWRSRSENKDGHLMMPDAIRDQLRNYSIGVESVSFLEPTVALVHARWHWENFVESNRPPENRNGLLTMVMVKKSDSWRIRALQNTRTDDQ